MHPTNKEIIIALCAGEASGDLLGAHLIDALKKHYPYSRFIGIGGPRMKAAGLFDLYEQEPLAVRGYFEVLGNVSSILKIRRGLIADLKNIRPHVFVGIDSPDFNLPVAAKLRSVGIPCLHYVSPSVWAWKSGRVKKIVKQVNQVLCLFPMEPELYREAGGNAQFVGHPLAQMLPMENSKVATRERLKLDITAPVFTLMPGSRISEIDYMAPVFLRAAALILDKLPDAVFLLPYPSAPVRETLLKYLNQDEFKQLPVRLQAAKTELACMAADVVLVTSGTAALEVALCKRPMVISYRISPFTYALVRRKIKIPHIGLPNILLGKEVVPELIQKDATPEKLATAVLDWYYHPVRSAELEKEFTKLHRSLLRNTDELAAYAVLREAGVAVSAPAEYIPPETETAEPESTETAVQKEVAASVPETSTPPASEPEAVAQAEAAPLTQTHAAETKVETTVQAAPNETADDSGHHPEGSLFGKIKKWFGNDDDTPPTPAKEAAVRLAEDVAEAHNMQQPQPTRRVLEEDELPAAVSPINLPISSVLQKNSIFDKYREQAEAAEALTQTASVTDSQEMPEPVASSDGVIPTEQMETAQTEAQHPKSINESVYAKYINQISMAWLPDDMAKRAQTQQAAQQAVMGENETPESVTAEIDNSPPPQQPAFIVEETAQEATQPAEAEAEHISPPPTPEKKRISVSQYSTNPQRYGRKNGNGIYF